MVDPVLADQRIAEPVIEKLEGQVRVERRRPPKEQPVRLVHVVHVGPVGALENLAEHSRLLGKRGAALPKQVFVLPHILQGVALDHVLDGELLVVLDGAPVDVLLSRIDAGHHERVQDRGHNRNWERREPDVDRARFLVGETVGSVALTEEPFTGRVQLVLLFHLRLLVDVSLLVGNVEQPSFFLATVFLEALRGNILVFLFLHFPQSDMVVPLDKSTKFIDELNDRPAQHSPLVLLCAFATTTLPQQNAQSSTPRDLVVCDGCACIRVEAHHLIDIDVGKLEQPPRICICRLKPRESILHQNALGSQEEEHVHSQHALLRILESWKGSPCAV
mmetsp:Transcript_14783/g.36115  ORF Transcript_14783/g.36115 Transcript_14783/m.36115 type:complete len:333 (-) Transcript_14783:1768-2766(-)